MKIKFLKDHVDYKEGDVVSDHPNAEYLKILGVAVELKEEKAEPAKESPKKGKK